MDFFGQQDVARRKTGQLIVLFALAVAAIVVAIYALVRLTFADAYQWVPPGAGFFDPWLAARTAFLTLAVILVGSVYKTLALHRGGRALASLLGGRELSPGATDPAERKLLNVVEEMSLAAGVPVPAVFVLDKENTINAFAAGFSPSEAVIAVTRGTLDKLDRDELQGVIGHEFSHIVNGDMRLNLRLVGVVHGILVIALIGKILLRHSGGSRKAALFMVVLGLVLLVIGSLGVLLGRLIKAALSRQREFLADASAVQFTRNPQGLAGALGKIAAGGGSKIKAAHAEEASHFFFADGLGTRSFFSLLSSHPPLAARLARLDPSSELVRSLQSQPRQGVVGKTLDEMIALPLEGEVVVGQLAPPDAAAAQAKAQASRLATLPAAGARPGQAAAAVVAAVGQLEQRHVDYARELMARLPAGLVAAVREPLAAQAVVIALLLDRDPEVRRRQSASLEGAPQGLLFEIPRLAPLVHACPPEARLPLLDLALPALGRLSPPQYADFAGLVEKLVQADANLSLFELALQRALFRNLGRRFDPVAASRPPQVYALGKLEKEISLLFSALARASDADAEKAFDTGAAQLRGFGQLSLALLPAAICDLPAVDKALRKLDELTPKMKKPLLAACAAVVAADRQVAMEEAELLRAIADTLGCPVPPLLAGQKAA
jgi:Zn-dependent protease with chaperone function